VGIESPKNCAEDEYMEFHDHLKRLRESKEMSQLQTAEAIGIAKNTYIGYEKGSREPRLSELKKLANLFGVGLGELCLEDRDSGLTGWLKASFEAAKNLRARDKAALIQVINGYVAARMMATMSISNAPTDMREELESHERILADQEDYELDQLVKLEAAIEGN
jgi:transcriptional regulator with XRE-family HTH domain